MTSKDKIKFLFLPHCLTKSLLEKIKIEAEKRGYEVYVAKGGSMIKNIIEKYNNSSIGKIVGIACDDEIGLALNFLEAKKIAREKIFPIPLLICGCQNTEVDLEKVWGVL